MQGPVNKVVYAFILTLFCCISVSWAQKNPPQRAGTIAYVRGSTEVRLINADGTNDRKLWTHPDATKDLGIFDVAWRPDGKELVFSSGHAAASSLITLTFTRFVRMALVFAK